MMLSIKGPGFMVGLVLGKEGFVREVPPLIKYMRGWHMKHVVAYCQKRNWKCEVIEEAKE